MESIPDWRKQGQVEQDLPFTILCIAMAMLTGNPSQESMHSWIRANYDELRELYFSFFEAYPLSIGPISQPSISRILASLSTDYVDKIVSKLGQTDFQKAWLEYAKHRIKILEAKQFQSIILGLKQTLSKQSIRVLAVDGKSRKGVIGNNNKTVIDLTVYDVHTGLVLYRVTIPEKKGEATIFSKFAESKEFLDLVNLINKSKIVFTADAGITSRLIADILAKAGVSYCLAIKGNAGNVHDIIKKMSWNSKNLICFEEKGHGREEKRVVQVLKLSQLKKTGLFLDIIAEDPNDAIKTYQDSFLVAKVTSTVRNKNRKGVNEISVHTRFFILGGNLFKELENEKEIVAAIIRSHWQIESNHWVKDVVLHEDNCLTKTPNSSQILGAFRDISLALTKIFTNSPTQFIRELRNNIKNYWLEIGLGIYDEKKTCYG